MSSTAIDPMKRDYKKLAMSDNFRAFRTAIVYLLVVLPIWLVVLLPITLASLLIEGAVGLVTGGDKKKNDTKAKSDDGGDYGTFEEVSNVTSTKAREFDLVLYGATGTIQLLFIIVTLSYTKHYALLFLCSIYYRFHWQVSCSISS